MLLRMDGLSGAGGMIGLFSLCYEPRWSAPCPQNHITPSAQAALHYITLHYITLHFISLHFIIDGVPVPTESHNTQVH